MITDSIWLSIEGEQRGLDVGGLPADVAQPPPRLSARRRKLLPSSRKAVACVIAIVAGEGDPLLLLLSGDESVGE